TPRQTAPSSRRRSTRAAAWSATRAVRVTPARPRRLGLLDREAVHHGARTAGDVVVASACRPADELAADAGRAEDELQDPEVHVALDRPCRRRTDLPEAAGRVDVLEPPAARPGRHVGHAAREKGTAALVVVAVPIEVQDVLGVRGVQGARVAGEDRVTGMDAGRPRGPMAESDDETDVGIGLRLVHDAGARGVAHQGVPVPPVVPRLGIRNEARVAVVEPVPVLTAAAYAR